MSGQDVIELDSSDDDCQPSRPPKPKALTKKPQKRPMLNAMVHIPTGKGSSYTPNLRIPKIQGSTKVGSVTVKSNKNLGIINGPKLPNVTIKPLKQNPTHTPSKPVKVMNPFANDANGKAPVVSQFINKTPVHVSNKLMNAKNPNLVKIHPGPVSVHPSLSHIMQKIGPQVKMAIESKMTPQQKLALQQKKTPHKAAFKLPPGITLTKKTTPPGPLKRPATVTKPTPVPKKVRRERPQPVTVATVELDGDDDDADDQPKPSSSSVQWYVRPEDNIKEQNEKEPEQPKTFDIIIEDSPIKPILNKRTCEIEKEMPISIDDSPVKPPDDNGKDKQDDNSDEEPSNTPRTPSSRKKLNYPQGSDTQNFNEQTIEIEIEPYSSDPLTENVVEKQQEEPEHLIIEIQESPVRKKGKYKIYPDGTRKMRRRKLHMLENYIILDDEEYKDVHPVFKSFIQLCFKLDSTPDMQKIVERKIKSYYLQVPKDFTESEEFIELVSGKIDLMNSSPSKLFLYIKDVVDELNIQRKLARQLSYQKEKEEFDDSDPDVKRRRQIRKLEKTLKKLHRAINKLEEQEVDFDDDGDSVYILTERYKERLIRVHAKLCQLSNVKMPSEPRVTIDARPGQPTGSAKRLEKWINRRVPMGTPLPFPDFHDVLRCVKEANKEDDLGWNDAHVMEEARDLFTRCGKKLQRRRQENEWRVAASRLTAEDDPAELSDELKRKLDDNRRAAQSKETDLINKYADRQKQLKLEAVEIGDHEAEESPVESEDDSNDVDDDAKLDNSQERKQRLKRLLTKKNNGTKITSEQSKEGLEDDVLMTELPAERSPPKIGVEVAEVEPHKHNKKNKNIENDGINEKDTINKTTNNESKNSDDKDKEMDVDSNENETNDKTSDKVNKTTKDDKDKSAKTKDRQQSVETLSDDDSQKIDSDIDELHLLQKMHTDEVYSLESSDSEGLIAISDSIESGDDKDKKNSSDVVSIENSSSESEQEGQGDADEVKAIQYESNDSLPLGEESDDDDLAKFAASYNEKDFVLRFGPGLGSRETSNESTDLENQDDSTNDESYTSTNLKDDALSIGDTLVEEANDSTKIEDAKVDSASKSKDIDNKDLNVVESSSVNIQDCKKSNSTKEFKTNNVRLTEIADFPIDCDSESNEAKSNENPDETDNKKLNEVESSSVNIQNDKESNSNEQCKTSDGTSTQITDSPINCDSESNKTNSNEKPDETNNTKLNKKESSSVNVQNYNQSKSNEARKTNDETSSQITDSTINCDSESNEAKSNDRSDKIDNKKLNKVENSFVNELNNTEAAKENDSIQPAEFALDCDQDSHSNDKSGEKIESSETITISFEPDDISIHDEVNSTVGMDVDIVGKEIEIEIPEKEKNLEVSSKKLNEDHSDTTDDHVDSNVMEVDISSNEKEVEKAKETPKEVEGKEEVGCSEEKRFEKDLI